MAPKDKDTITNKSGASIDINVVKMGVKKNTLESVQEPLQQGSKNTRSPSLLNMTIVTCQVMKLPLTILP